MNYNTHIEALVAADRPQIDVAILAAGDQNAARFAQVQAGHLLRVRLYLIWRSDMCECLRVIVNVRVRVCVGVK